MDKSYNEPIPHGHAASRIERRYIFETGINN
jgi:hypothetical protein